MNNDELLKRAIDARKEIEKLGDQAVKAVDDQYLTPMKQLRDAVEKERIENENKLISDLNDPLRMPSGRETDIRWLPSGAPDPKSFGNVIHQYTDAERFTFYTNVPIFDLKKIRTLRNQIAAQQKVWDTIPEVERTRMEAEFRATPPSKGAATPANPFQDLLQSRMLGQRYAELQKHPGPPSIRAK